jgi:MFS family permease
MTAEVSGDRDFAKYWASATVSSLGSAVTTVAMPVLVVRYLSATSFEVGLVNAAQLLPYLVWGLLAGVFIDRRRRRPILIWASIGRAALLAAVPGLWLIGALSLPVLIVILVGFGSLSVFGVAATQSFLPAVVTRQKIIAANARLDQSDAVAQTIGPAAGGTLVGLLGAPLALLIDAVSFVADAVLIRSMTTREPAPDRPRRSVRIGTEIRAGIAWTYRHPTLAPMAFSTHAWFFGNSVAVTALVPYALRGLGMGSFIFGLMFALGGVLTLAGAMLAARIGARLGTGPTIVVCRVGYALPWIAVAMTASTAIPTGVAIVTLFAALAFYGLVGGVENANEVGYRQLVTPPEFLGRVNSTVRSANRTFAFIGAFVGGALAGAVGFRAAFLVGAAALAAAFVIAVATPLRSARAEGVDEADELEH